MNRIPIYLMLTVSLPVSSFAATNNPDRNAVVAGNTQFALDLYGKLRATEGNLFFSPHSIATALAMTYGGARGETEQQMARALHFDLPQERLHPAFAALNDGLNKVQKKGEVQLHVANSLWPHNDHPFRPDYVKLCKRHYGVSITPVDYARAAEDARRAINAWVEDKTQKKITDLIPPGMLTSLTRLVLANAIYFKGNWASRFEARRTKAEPFHLTADRTVPTPLMHQKGKFGYAEHDGLQVLELPYVGGELSMLVLLPRRVDGLGELEDKLTAQQFAAWTKDLRKRELLVYLPKFKTTAQFSLNNALAALGITDAFDEAKADFSGMDGQRGLFISAVVHKAFVDVNEEGTEAAAATGVGVRATLEPPPPPVFRADRPLLYLIRENHTGSLLFLGRLADPSRGEK
jgi:serpin B